MRSFRRIFFIILILTMLPVLTGTTRRGIAQSTTEWVCEETGFAVRGEFLEYYRSTSNELELFGYPITNEIDDGMGHLVQYFQKARFDLDEVTALVHAAPLGSYLYTDGEYKKADFSNDSSNCQIFSNGYAVCYGFTQFYNAKNGAAYLGMPISNTEINAAGFFTQYFEKAVLEWHPERPAGQRVVVADIGRMYYDRYVGDIHNLRPEITRDFLPGGVLLIPKVDVFTSKAVVSANSTEEIFVIVKDQYQRPLPNAKVSIEVGMPDGSIEKSGSTYTDQDGIAILDILIGNVEPRAVLNIEALVTVDREITTAHTWLRIWW
jgi:hypothetical protein